MILTLQSWNEIQKSRDQLKERGLDFTDPLKTRLWRFLFDLRFRYRLYPPQPDIVKSWDVARAAELIERVVQDKKEPILDMGCYNSEILYVLRALGYKTLHGCDLNPICRWMPFWNRIQYRVADLTETLYPQNYFAALTALSVIEHGVSLEKLVEEVRRILRPGGLFIFTTDYDATGEDHRIREDSRVFGQSWTIFNQSTLHSLIQQFLESGFELLKPNEIMDNHTERPIFWNGQNYTFVLVALRAPGLAQ